jgi:hypothetical protein
VHGWIYAERIPMLNMGATLDPPIRFGEERTKQKKLC